MQAWGGPGTTSGAGPGGRPAALASGRAEVWSPGVDDELAALVLEVFQGVLAKPNISPDDDFFNLGGNSVKAVKVADQLGARLGRTISPILILLSPNARDLAITIASTDEPGMQ